MRLALMYLEHKIKLNYEMNLRRLGEKCSHMCNIYKDKTQENDYKTLSEEYEDRFALFFINIILNTKNRIFFGIFK